MPWHLTGCWSYAYTCQRTCICLLSLVLVYELYITYVWKSDVTYHYRHFHYRHFHLTGFGCWPLRNDVWADSKEKTVIHWFPMNNNHVWNIASLCDGFKNLSIHALSEREGEMLDEPRTGSVTCANGCFPQHAQLSSLLRAHRAHGYVCVLCWVTTISICDNKANFFVWIYFCKLTCL